MNALSAADEVLIPLQPHFLALQGFGKLLETVALVQRRINRRLRVCGVLLCMFESATKLAAEVTEDIQSFLKQGRDNNAPWAGAKLFETRIRRNVKLAECPSFGQTINAYAPQSHGAADYEALADEFWRCIRWPPRRPQVRRRQVKSRRSQCRPPQQAAGMRLSRRPGPPPL